MEENLMKRIRFRNVCGVAISVPAMGLMGLGAGSLVNEWWSVGALLLAASAAWITLGITAGFHLMEKWNEKHYPLLASHRSSGAGE